MGSLDGPAIALLHESIGGASVMRRAGLAISATMVAIATTGCASMSVGLWADSDRGQSVASIVSIELPPEPSSLRESTPAVERSGKPPLSSADEWDLPVHLKPSEEKSSEAKLSDIPKAIVPSKKPTPIKIVEIETWTPKVEPGAKPAEFGAEPTGYRWIQGRVSYLKISGSRVWKIRFAPIDQVDKFGGSFVLDGKLPDDLKDGDLVRINGCPAAIQDARQPRYQCERITFMERNERPFE